MKKIFNFLFNRWTLAILGLVAISLLIWFIGPLLAVADYRPLESDSSRMILISLIIGFYVIKHLWAWITAKKLNIKFMEGLLQQSSPAQEDENDAGKEEVKLLHKRFEEAVNILKKTDVIGTKEKSKLSTLLPRQYIYELPWYIFIGAPGSGKTTALINSGVQFPLADYFGKDKIGGVGGTRNCDWWFTNEAVLLDTAGRYTTHESDQAVDRTAWIGFLNLLKKYRPHRPINGIFIAISISDLLQQNAQQREKQALEIRKRIQELYTELNIRFPIYILVTKIDLLAGFMEFFNKLGKEERSQVWGTSFQLSELENDQPLSSYAAEFGQLEKRLNDRLTTSLQEERDLQRRALLYVFPQQFSNLKNTLVEYLDQIFSASRYEQQPFLRGIYFTSGTQIGNPIDRVMGNLARAFNLDHNLLVSQQPSGKSFFLTRLLKEVIFTESELAGTNQRWERKQASLQWGLFFAGILLTVGMIAAWTLSYTNNKTFIDDVAEKIKVVSADVEDLPVIQHINLVSLLPTLKSVQALTRTSDHYDGSVPMDMGFGLYQGDKLSAAANNTYHRLLQDTFLPQLILRIEYLLNYTSRNNPELLYEALKAYIMLYDAEHFDADALKAFIIMDWETTYPHELTTEQRNLLEYHLNNLFNQDRLMPPIQENPEVIERVRTILTQTPIAQRIYNRLKRQNIGADIPEFTILKATGPSASLVFSRKSGKPLNQGVPGLYRFDGYYDTFFDASEEVAKQLKSEEKWVLHPEKNDSNQISLFAFDQQLLDEVRRLYLHDYVQIWESYIHDIRLVHSDSLQESIELTRLLSADDSPLPILLKAIVKEVTLVNFDDTEKNFFNKTEHKVRKTSEKLKQLLGREDRKVSTASMVSRPEIIVDNRFEDLRNLVSGSAAGQPAPIDTIQSQINELYLLLTSIEVAMRSGATPPSGDAASKIKADAQKTPEPIRSLMTTLSTTGINQALGEKRANLNQALLVNVTDFCRKAINNRYPFQKDSTQDVTQDDFSRIFAVGGQMDDFFQSYLTQYTDTTQRVWRFRDGDTSMRTTPRDLQQFQRAKMIRDVFFQSGSNKVSIELTFKPIDMDASITQFILDIDGQLIKYSHGPQIPTTVQWPGTRGSSQVRLQISLADTGSILSGQVFEGPWALFRMLDNVQITPLMQPDKFIVDFKIENRNARFEVSSNSILNPFRMQELAHFNCPAKL